MFFSYRLFQKHESFNENFFVLVDIKAIQCLDIMTGWKLFLHLTQDFIFLLHKHRWHSDKLYFYTYTLSMDNQKHVKFWNVSSSNLLRKPKNLRNLELRSCFTDESRLYNSISPNTAQKVKFFMKDFNSKFEQIGSFLRIWSYLLKKPLIENFIFCAVKILPEA